MSKVQENSTVLPDEPKPFLHILCGIGYFGAFIGAQTITSFILLIVWGMQKAVDDASKGLSLQPEALENYLNRKLQENANLLIIIYTLILFAFLLLLFLIRKKNFFQETRLRKLSNDLIPALMLLAIGLALFLNAALNLLPQSILQDYTESATPLLGMSAFGIAMISNVICAPLSEEVIFRGLMLTRFNRAFPKWAGILFTALIFGIMHGQYLWITYAAILGILFGWVAEYTDNTTASLLLHFIFNLIGTVLSYSNVIFTLPLIVASLVGGLAGSAYGFYLLITAKKMIMSCPEGKSYL